MYRLHFPVLTLFWSADVKFLMAKSFLPRWGFVDIHSLSRGLIRTCWWTLGFLSLGSSESMCDQLRSGRNTWWLLIKLSIPVHVIPPLQTHPHPKKEKKILRYHTKTSLPHEISSRPEIPPTHATKKKITHGAYIVFTHVSATSTPGYFQSFNYHCVGNISFPLDRSTRFLNQSNNFNKNKKE